MTKTLLPWLALAPSAVLLLALAGIAIYRRIRFGSWYR